MISKQILILVKFLNPNLIENLHEIGFNLHIKDMEEPTNPNQEK